MPKIVIFSDLHAHAFGPYSSVLEDGTNSRLQDSLNVIREVREVAKQVDADAVFFTGDLFHERRHIVTQAFSKVYEEMSMFAVDGMPLLAFDGNHDQADRLGRHHALRPFGTFATIAECGWQQFNGKEFCYNILAVPYIENANKLLEAISTPPPEDLSGGATIFLGHFGLQGAKLGSDFVYTNGAEPTVEDLPVGRFDAGFLGHFHLHQEVAPNWWYVGAPMQHNWGDKGQERGCMVYDTDTGVGSHIPFEGVTPKFVELTVVQLRSRKKSIEAAQDNIVKVLSDKPWTEDQIEETRERLGALSLEVSGKKEDKHEAFEVRLKIEAGASWDEMASEYVKSGLAELDGLEEEWLIDVGRKLLAEVS